MCVHVVCVFAVDGDAHSGVCMAFFVCIQPFSPII